MYCPTATGHINQFKLKSRVSKGLELNRPEFDSLQVMGLLPYYFTLYIYVCVCVCVCVCSLISYKEIGKTTADNFKRSLEIRRSIVNMVQ